MKDVVVERQQFPLVLAYAMTIHKSQGLTLNNVMADVGNKIFNDGMTYVALSRVKRLNGLHLMNFDPNKARASAANIKEVNRLRKTINIPVISYKKSNKGVEPDRVWYTPVFQKSLFDRTEKSDLKRKIEIERALELLAQREKRD
jgi:hypothetical protein